jgi:hypothetical protein
MYNSLIYFYLALNQTSPNDTAPHRATPDQSTKYENKSLPNLKPNQGHTLLHKTSPSTAGPRRKNMKINPYQTLNLTNRTVHCRPYQTGPYETGQYSTPPKKYKILTLNLTLLHPTLPCQAQPAQDRTTTSLPRI